MVTTELLYGDSRFIITELLYGDSRFDGNKNKIILEATINYLKNSERFSGFLGPFSNKIYIMW